MGTSNDKKDRIVQAAFSVVMKHGVQELSFKSVAKEAGLARQLIRYYFEDSEALMIALCDYLAGLYREALISGASEVDDKNRLGFFFDFYFDLLEDHPKPRDDQAYDAVMAIAAGSEMVRNKLRIQYGLLGYVVSHEIQVSNSDMSSQDCLELSYLFVCLMYGHWKMVATLGYCEDHKYITRQAIDRLLHSYSHQSHESPALVRPWSEEV